MTPLVLINAVGLTRRLLPLAPQLHALAQAGWCVSLREVVPAVTCSAQATILTGQPPQGHGIVGNGWLWRETGEVRFWLQSNRLLQAEPIYQTARRLARQQGRSFRCAQLFWWFNQGAAVDYSVTPKPYYGADGDKRLGITGTPAGLTERLERQLGPFPFFTFWGPKAGLPCTQWIAQCAAVMLRDERPDLTLVYLPHLDYDLQRFGPVADVEQRLLRELDEACTPVLDAARRIGARVWIVSEYGLMAVRRAVTLNRLLRHHQLLTVRPGPFGEHVDLFNSRAFAVCDHQVAHIYVDQSADQANVRQLLAEQPGVARVAWGEERAALGLNHPRAGDLIALAAADSWFAYPYWLNDDQAPDFARTVDIHRKPGYDPCELFFDPRLRWPQGRMLLRLAQKKLGWRTLFDVVPLDPSLVRGSHGVPAVSDADRPLLIGDDVSPSVDVLPMTAVHQLLAHALGLEKAPASAP
ncbi:MAG: alkaline phosphatase family protein [Gemmataceae bacterium]